MKYKNKYRNIISFQQFRDVKTTTQSAVFFPEDHFVHFENIEDVLFQIVKHKLFPIKDIPNHICLYRVHQGFRINLFKK